LRGELGPEARLADAIVENVKTLARMPDLIRRIEAKFPAAGGAPPLPPFDDDIPVKIRGGAFGYVLAALGGAAICGLTVAATVLTLH
jgi:ubiquinone biosynthesis protein